MFAKQPSNLNDDLSDLIGSPMRETPAQAPEGYMPAAERAFAEPCRKCGGSGNWRPGYPCFTCKGSGKQVFKTDAKTRAGARQSRENSKAAKIEAFKAEHPDVWAWMDGSSFPPAIEMRAKLEKYGNLFDSSIDFARRMIVRRTEKAAEAKAAQEAKQAEIATVTENKPVNVDALTEAFAKAAANTKRPRLWFGDVKIYPAKEGSKWQGSLYVRDQGQGLYLGRVTAGKFVASRECSVEQAAEIMKIIADPKGAAIAAGKLTGSCSVCRRTLTDPVSVASGIGPICATGMGW